MRRVDYDSVARTYDERYRGEIFSQLEARLCELVGGQGLEVLEVGCGTGHWLERLSATGARVTGIDASREMLAAARARLPEAELVHGRAESLPWPDARFDRVLCVNAIHHFDDKRAFVREARRVVRSGGSAVIVALDPHSGEDRWWVYDYFESTLALDRARCPSAAQIREWMDEAGFATCRTVLVQHLALRMSLEQAVAEGHTKRSAASQLTMLSDDEYALGMERVERAAAEARARGETLMLDGDLRFYATIGSASVTR
ncbi:MAG: class I SAM-dependent methyltransferase [Deltaproteobacteria bacterium]|nr:class I SAM-dependent methyltransferase [Deltaproteobacteria bacterium]